MENKIKASIASFVRKGFKVVCTKGEYTSLVRTRNYSTQFVHIDNETGLRL